MIGYGTKVVAGVTPGKGGQLFDGVVPVFDTVADAVRETEANTSVIYVPAAVAASAIFESADAGIPLIVCITEGIPVLDMTRVLPYLHERGARLIGPNCPGLISPGRARSGSSPATFAGPAGWAWCRAAARSPTRSCISCPLRGWGSPPASDRRGSAHRHQLHPLPVRLSGRPRHGCGRHDRRDRGTDEQHAADFVQQTMTKPVVGFIAGQTAPPGRRMGHAGAIISGSSGTAAEKMAAFARAGIAVMKRPADVVPLLKERL